MVGEIGSCLPLEPIRDISDIVKAREAIQESSKLIAPESVTQTISESAKVTIT